MPKEKKLPPKYRVWADARKRFGLSNVQIQMARDGSAEAFYRKNGFYISPKMVMMGKYLEAPKA